MHRNFYITISVCIYGIDSFLSSVVFNEHVISRVNTFFALRIFCHLPLYGFTTTLTEIIHP